MGDRPRLRALAEMIGILPSYRDYRNVERHTSDATRVALLAAMRIDATTEAAAARALAELAAERAARLVPPVVVSQQSPRTLVVDVSSLNGRGRRGKGGSLATGGHNHGKGDGFTTAARKVSWDASVTTEDGETHHASGRTTAGSAGSIRLRIPVTLPLGYHQVRVAIGDGAARREAEQTMIVTPSRCPTAGEVLRDRSVCGILANLYTLRDDRNWGAGDFGDLGALVAWCGEIGAAFVGVNPLHAIGNRGDEISPYRPISRLYRNPLYVAIEAVPELRESAEARARLGSRSLRAELTALRATSHVAYERVMTQKRPVLETLYRTFRARHRDRDTARGRAYRAYLEREGGILDDFATFMTIAELRGRDDPRQRDWHAWPADLRDARGAAVAEFRRGHRDQIDFHRWVQFALDQQLAAIAEDAGRRALPIGVYQDLAIGSSPSGSDTWGFRDLFLEDVSVGAPPDEYSAAGQNWGLPPIEPRALARDRFRYWTHLVRNALQHAGALRIDHVMGLFRQFWIPAGASGTDGAYIAFPSDDLLAILALESARAGALVVGEDLGTVPRGLPRRLARWGILSTRVLYFARGKNGTFIPSARYPARALASANTHDMAPLPGFWEGRDLELRRGADLIESDEALASAREDRARERQALVRRLSTEGLLPSADTPRDDVELIAAVHAFLGRTPAALVGVSLDDLAGEREPVNLPGVGVDRYTSWSRRLQRTLAELRTSPDVERMLAGLRGRRARVRRKRAPTSRARPPARVAAGRSRR